MVSYQREGSLSGLHKVFMAVIVTVSIFVLFWIGRRAARTVPLDLEPGRAATTTRPSIFGLNTTVIKTPKGMIYATVASTTETREIGLSGVPSMSDDSGMLFVFDDAGRYSFWMKDMVFSLDMVWVGADKKVSGITANISPRTYPEVFYPPSEIKYVLELNSGGAKDHDIAVGTKLVF